MFRKPNYIVFAVMAAITAAISITACQHDEKKSASIEKAAPATHTQPQWIIPDSSVLTASEQDQLIKYGRALIVNTAFYFGPEGVIAHKSNGMNCQNCHLNAGTKLFGNNFSLSATGYPRFKERSATIENLVKKVQDCFERSLNGKRIDSNSREMKAFVAYLEWIGKNVKKGTKPVGSGIEELAFLDRPADTAKGHAVFVAKCQTCHQKDGQGTLNAAGWGYTYPPLWGEHSYNIGASIYRLSKFAGFIKSNMPFGADHQHEQLSNAEAWDVAAFVNSQQHTYKNVNSDYPKLSTKPYDDPFGPFADKQFSENQRKYGPYGPIKSYYASADKKDKKK
ncbi:MAG TPA: c-type cytochrome [Mucilaginibacter sp.]|jgi:thiosulfate dehydrogenase|nr:c-type cytochrome [Mucilaginibacter sp.]